MESCPPSWVKIRQDVPKTWRTQKNLQDACKPTKKGNLLEAKKNCKKNQATARLLLLAVKGNECGVCACIHLPFAKRQFFPPTLVMQSGFDHIHLNGEGQKKFRQFVVRNMAAKKPQVAVRAGCCAARSFLRGCMGRVCTGKFLTGAGFARPNQRLATA